jgi:hypothetical protein
MVLSSDNGFRPAKAEFLAGLEMFECLCGSFESFPAVSAFEDPHESLA